MNKLTKIFFALAVAALTGLSSVPAMAQVQFNSAGGSRIVRAEGITETVSGVSLVATTAGTIVTGSSINIQYDGTITNTPGAANVVCAVCGGNVAVTFTGNTFTISFTANVLFAIGDSISVGGVRINASALGAGVTAARARIFSVGDPITNLVTYNPTEVPVATLSASLTGLIPTVSPVNTILTCAPTTSPANGSGLVLTGGAPGPTQILAPGYMSLTGSEAFAAALALAAQETGFSNTPAATASTTIVITINGVPAGFRLVPVSQLQSTNTGAALAVAPAIPLTFGALPANVNQTTSGTAITLTYTITGTDNATAESFTFGYHLGTSTGAPVAAGGSTGPITATISIGPITTTGIVRMAANATPAGTIANVSDCVTRLEYSWVVNTAGYDTGIAIANTTKDDEAYGTGVPNGATAQSGPCVLTGYPAGGGTPISFTTASIPAGQTLAFTISGTTGFSGFSGYVLAVCNFLNAHSFAFITNGFGSTAGPNLAQGYQALVVPAGTRVIPGGEALGH